jgi:hypothetical protein
MRPSVEILRNQDGTYSLYIYGREVLRGTYEECEQLESIEDWSNG